MKVKKKKKQKLRSGKQKKHSLRTKRQSRQQTKKQTPTGGPLEFSDEQFQSGDEIAGEIVTMFRP